MRKETRQLIIQYPDGRLHTIQVNRFYGVLVEGREEYVLEYDDLTDNNRNCFTILDRENNTFVKRPLSSQSEYMVFAARIRFMPKKPYDLNLLPGKIGLCRTALEALRKEQQGKKPSTAVAGAGNPPLPPRGPGKPRKKIIVYVDVAPNHDVFPFYLDAETARFLGLSNSAGGYYHLTEKELEEIKLKFDIQYKNVNLGLGMFTNAVSPVTPEVSRVQTNGEKRIIIYIDVAPNHDNFPYYLDSKTAKALGFVNIINGYYHLIPSELDKIKKEHQIQYKNVELSFGPNLHTTRGAVTPSKEEKGKDSNTITIYEDISPVREKFPYYITKKVAESCGLHTDKEYYHLRQEEVDVIRRYAIVKLEKKELAILKQPVGKRVEELNKPVTLSPDEIEQLEALFDKLMNFEDYYSFFGLEGLINAPEEYVLKSPRIEELTQLFNKGISCNNEFAVNLADFLEGFKKSLIDKIHKK